jgi:putative tricarboxylic transport membrane protein
LSNGLDPNEVLPNLSETEPKVKLSGNNDFPVAPVIVGMILGPLAEAQMRNALSIGEGHWRVFWDRPMSFTLLCVVATCLLLPPIWSAWQRRKSKV